jgi:hypothetical protein
MWRKGRAYKIESDRMKKEQDEINRLKKLEAPD